MKFFFLSLLPLLLGSTASGQLIINELSQGPSGNQEFIELLVTGTPACGGSNTVDLRGWVIDDNNSWHASGTGTGIAGGHARFDSINQWANVKIGSLILIYNDADMSAPVSALTVDTTDANNDGVYIVPVSSSVIQKNITLPASNGTMTTYGVPGTVYSPTGTYISLGMANGGDAFHTVSPANYTTAYFAIGWGNNNTAVDIYYSSSQGGKVIYMANTVDNDPFNQANFIDSSAATQETPGAPNTPANAAWVSGMYNNGQAPVVPIVTLNNPAPLGCNNTSTIIIASTNATGATFNWSNGPVTASDTVTTIGTYTVTVTDASGACTASATVNVSGSSGLSITTTSTNTTCGASDGTASVTLIAGTALSYNWSNGDTTAFASSLPAGVYSVTVDGGSGCSASATVTVGSSSGPTVAITAADTIFCSGDSVIICAPNGTQTYLWNTGETSTCIYAKLAGNYYVTATENNGCTALSNPVSVAVYAPPPVSISVNGNTLTAYSAVGYQWYLDNAIIQGANDSIYVVTIPGNYSVMITDTNGCSAVSNPVPVMLTGIAEENSETFVRIFPNPLMSGNFSVEVSEAFIRAKAELYNAEGQLIYSVQINSVRFYLPQTLAKGIYWLKLQTDSTAVAKKLVRM